MKKDENDIDRWLPDLFIPSYHRSDNLKTVKYFAGNGYPCGKIWVVIDSEADDKEEYSEGCGRYGVNLEVFDMDEARKRYDYIHRASESRRSAGQARNMFYDIAESKGIDFFVMQDDDTEYYEYRPFSVYKQEAEMDEVKRIFLGVREFMQRKRIGLFGLSQTGDMMQIPYLNLIRPKVMNTTFIDTRFIYRGERGVQDNDTSQFAGVMNEGYFTGSLGSGLVLHQTLSATAKGGLTDLYNECELLNKSLVTVIQFPSAIISEKQVMNGGRIHHRIDNRYLQPKLMRSKDGRDNIAWDTYPEDVRYSNEPKRN